MLLCTPVLLFSALIGCCHRMSEDNLKRNYQEIEVALEELNIALDSIECIQSCVYIIPRIQSEDTYAPIKEIIPERLDDFLAQTRGKRVLSEFYGDATVSTKCPIKMPGLLQYIGNPMVINTLVVALNRAKDAFKQTVVSIGNEDEQFRIVHSLYPYLINEQLTRHVNIASQGLQSIGFSFTNKQLSDTISAKAAEALLEKNYFSPRDLMSPKLWQEHIDKAIERVKHLPHNMKLVKRRDGKVQPLTNLRYDFGYRQKAGSLPVIYVSETNEKIKVNELKPYFAENKQKNKRPAKVGNSKVIEPWLRLYSTPIIEK